MRRQPRSRSWLVLICLGLAVLVAGCPKPPKKALADAENALLDARGVKDCASEEYEAAKRLLDEAQELSEAGEYDKAERKAKAAKKLAIKAKKTGEANWEDCKEQEKVAEKARGEDEEKTQQPGDGKKTRELKTVFFSYDSADLTAKSREKLQNNATWIENHPNTQIRLEGHTDERGTPEYNLALGESRARTVRQFLIKLGIDGSRLDVLSYGEEKPRAYGTTPEDFAKNRRVEFVPHD